MGLLSPSRKTKFSCANERGRGKKYFPCSADHEQDWQPYKVDPYSCYMCDHIFIFASEVCSVRKILLSYMVICPSELHNTQCAFDPPIEHYDKKRVIS